VADDEQQERLLTSSDVARRAGVSRRTVASWVQQGILTPDFITAGGQGRFRWSSVEAQLREHRRRST
jgi:DNA-binding transcriptional MerR regulator